MAENFFSSNDNKAHNATSNFFKCWNCVKYW